MPLLAGIDWLAPLRPIIAALTSLLFGIDGFTHNIGLSLVLMSATIALALWPLRHRQFKSAAAMQKLAPELKALQARHKSDPTKLNEATMALYKERGVNPLASCFPLLIQMPILLSVYQAIQGEKAHFNEGNFLWIGSPLTSSVPFLAHTLSEQDFLLLGLYIVSMYFSFKMAAPPADPQQAQQQQIMAFISPVMIGYFAIQNHWPSALVVYWLSGNLFTMGQQYLAMQQRKRAELKESSTTQAVLQADDAPAIRTGKRVRTVAALPPSTKNAGKAPGARLSSAGKPGSGNGSAQAGGQSGTSGSGQAKKNGNGTPNGSAKPGSGTNAAAKRRR